ncbi:MAG: hypothetical protein M3R26_00065 [Actinomycetota bacterium]|nr:hypothetical protein [Actinomycetota bacterium]
MIEIPELPDGQHNLWCDLIDLAATHRGHWTIIGAHMVALYAWETGAESRPSQDVDVLVNVRLAANGTQEISEFLQERGYEPEISITKVAHLFKRGTAQIDVLAPDGLGGRANTTTVRPNRTVMVPGGTQALGRSSAVSVRTRDVEGELPRPNLLGAVLVKVRAIEVDDLPDAQRADVALLLQLIDDPDTLAEDLAGTERKWLRRHKYFADPTDLHWDRFEAADPERAALVYRRLLE